MTKDVETDMALRAAPPLGYKMAPDSFMAAI